MTLAGIEINLMNNSYERKIQGLTQKYDAFYFPITVSVTQKLPFLFKKRLYPTVGFGLGYTVGYNFNDGLFKDGVRAQRPNTLKTEDGGLTGFTWKGTCGGILKLGSRTDMFFDITYISAKSDLDMSGMVLWSGFLFNIR